MSSIGSCWSEDFNCNDSVPSLRCARKRPVKMERMERMGEEEEEPALWPTTTVDRSFNTAQTMENSSLVPERECMHDTSYQTCRWSTSSKVSGSMGDMSSRWNNGSSGQLSLTESQPTLASKATTEWTVSSTQNALFSSSGGRSSKTRVSRRTRIRQRRVAAAKACAPSSPKQGDGIPALIERKLSGVPNLDMFVEGGASTYHDDTSKEDKRPCLVHRQSTKSSAELGRTRVPVASCYQEGLKDSRPCLVCRQSTKSSAELGRARESVPHCHDHVKDSRPCLVFRQSTKSSTKLGRTRRASVLPCHNDDVKDSRPSLVYRQSTKSEGELYQARASISNFSNRSF